MAEQPALAERVTGIEERIDRVEVKVDRGFESVDRRFEQVDKRFEQVDKRFEEVDKRFDKVDQRFDRVEESVRLLGVDLEEVKGDVRQIAEGHGALLARMDRTEQKLEGKIDEVKSLVMHLVDRSEPS